ncbi:MAG: 30S ribosomal protein S8 [candidate division TM6 bacterium GW2011_GWF2_38_10]|nr:MAG: 30S ribosomal protein S8 [candidate division TM6 bacterium GW2011_GWF2_38_10]
MSIDTIGNFLTAIRNGILVGKRSVTVPGSSLKIEMAKVLKEEGFIKDYTTALEGAKASLTIFLKYVNGESVIHEITRISKPGRRHYENVRQLTPVIGGLGIALLTTSAGVITDQKAKKLGVGGEILCHVW